MANGINKQVIQVGGNANDKGFFTDLTALQTAYPTGQNGWYAVLGSTDTVWVWDSGTSAWVDSGGSSTGTNLSYTASASNGIVVSDTGTDATIPLANGTNAGLSLNDYTTAEKSKLLGIATGAEVNINADWNSVSGDSQILNKPTISGSNTGDQTSIVGITGTKAQFDTAVTDGNFMYVGDAPTAHTHLLANITDVTMTVANLNSLDDGVNSTLHFHDADRARANHTGTQLASTISDFTEASQDAVGAMVDTSLVYVDGTPLLTRAALTGAITASQGSNATSLGSFTTAQLNTALSDNDIATGGGTATGTNTGDQSLFSTIAVSGQSNVVADSTSDTLTLVAGTNITITTNATTDEITINSTGGGGGTITVQDEGSTTSTTVTTLNFTGAGVTASGAGATATINIPGGSGSFTLSETEIDFGSGVPVRSKRFTITDVGISPTSKIMVSPSGNVATGRVGNDWEWDDISFIAKPGTGSFELTAIASGRVKGKRKILYSFS